MIADTADAFKAARVALSATEVHTPSGAHPKVSETWPHRAARTSLAASKVSASLGTRVLEDAAEHLAGVSRHAELAWLAAAATQ